MIRFIRTAPDRLPTQEEEEAWDKWGYVGHSVFSLPHTRSFDEIVEDHNDQRLVDDHLPIEPEEIALHLIRLIECGLVSIVPPSSTDFLVARPAREWHEDLGNVLWWCLPVQEPPYCGTLLDHNWPGVEYFTHFTLLPEPVEVPRA